MNQVLALISKNSTNCHVISVHQSNYKTLSNPRRKKKSTSTTNTTSLQNYLQSTGYSKARSNQQKSPSRNNKTSESTTKFKITQKVQDPTTQKSGPKIIKRNIDDAKQIQIGRRFGNSPITKSYLTSIIISFFEFVKTSYVLKIN